MNEEAREQTAFSNKDTQLAKGIAISMMILHHTFPSVLNYQSVYTFSLLQETVTIPVLIGRFCKLCVAIFTVLSGYGIAISCKGKSGDVLENTLIFRIKNMFFTYWKCFAVFVLARVAFGGEIFAGGEKTFLMNLFALKFDYCGAWWYVAPYIVLVALVPFFKRFTDRKNSVVTINLFWTFILWTFAAYMYPQIMNYPLLSGFSVRDPIWWIMYWAIQISPAFMMGWVIEKANLFSKYRTYFAGSVRGKIFSVLVIIVVFCGRTAYGCVAETQIPEFFFAAWFIIAAVTLLHNLPIINNLFLVLGKHSTNMWLLHAIVLYWIIPKSPLSMCDGMIGFSLKALLTTILALSMSWLIKKWMPRKKRYILSVNNC